MGLSYDRSMHNLGWVTLPPPYSYVDGGTFEGCKAAIEGWQRGIEGIESWDWGGRGQKETAGRGWSVRGR